MVRLGQHLNLVNLLGAVTGNITRCKTNWSGKKMLNFFLNISLCRFFISDDMMIIVEYCKYGSLQNILVKNRPTFIDQINRDTDTITSNVDSEKQQDDQNTTKTGDFFRYR